jgi:hypothetical protein
MEPRSGDKNEDTTDSGREFSRSAQNDYLVSQGRKERFGFFTQEFGRALM